MIEITDSPDITQWSDFVYNHKHGNIFQTPELAEVYKRTKNYEPITLAAIDTRNDEILSVLQAVVIKEPDEEILECNRKNFLGYGKVYNTQTLRRI